MMKFFLPIITAFFILSCNNAKTNTETAPNAFSELDTSINFPTFFPVGEFLKGQIMEIKKSNRRPLKITVKSGKLDSTSLKKEQLDAIFCEFYSPIIDSISYSPFFFESKFFDQTLNTITLTYDVENNLPDSIPWKHWDIYIDPESNLVKRIFLVKQIAPDKIRQLTWLPGKSCRGITIINNSSTEDEVIVKWNYTDSNDQ
jgi:hypothetical protein